MKNIPKALLKSVSIPLRSAASATDAAHQKKVFR